MKIAVVGLGLIGGSIAKTIKKNTSHNCYGIDTNKNTIALALSQEAIDAELTTDGLCDMDIVIVSLYAGGIVNFVLSNLDNFKKGAVVIDTCGVKSEIVAKLEKPLSEKGVHFVGCHPMAGREFSGFEYALDNLFDNASCIITPTEKTDVKALSTVKELAKQMRFRRVVESTPEKHDKVIAFTSQLAHVVSASYVKSPSLFEQDGFSAGSFKDMTRVAYLNENMWTELFMLNKEALIPEIESVIKALTDYRDCLVNDDSERLRELLKDSRELKTKSNEQIAKFNS
ncbi:MAG: prephenate dehydrogenase [Oscillospiraceae bacterium]|nr:prephenate dehydrogenase [Oscillospiraceae bacterium]